MHIKPNASKLKALGSKTTRILLAGAVGALMVPALALANYAPATDTDKAVMTGSSDASGDSWNGELKTGELVDNGDGTKTISYTGIAHSDLSHYQAYGLTTHITFDENGKVTKINLTSENDTFAGSWGYKNIAKSMDPVEGYLPDGCSFEVNKSDGLIIPTIKDTNNYGVSFSALSYYSVDADGNATAVKAETTSTGSGRGATSTYNDWDYTNGGLKNVPADVNVVCVCFSIGAESSLKFNTYFAVDASGNIDTDSSSVANKYIDSIPATTWVSDPDDINWSNSMADTNRNKWSWVMATIVLQRELASWNEQLQSDFEAEGEIDDLDTVSGATKTSEPFIEALNAAYADGYISSVADNVKMLIDEGEDCEADVNAEPKDRSYVEVNDNGEYVLTNILPYGEDRMAMHGTTMDKITTYAIDGEVSTSEILAMAKGKSSYAPLQEYSPKSIIGYEEDDGDPIYSEGWPDFKDISGDITVDYDSTDGMAPIVVTANNKKITHMALTYTIGHGTLTVVYDLAEMAKVPAVIDAIDNISCAADIVAARSAYDALSTDVRGFVTNIDELVEAEERIEVSISGETRYETSAAVIDEALALQPEGYAGVIIANAGNFPDALAASGLAGSKDYPVLLCNTDEVQQATADALDKMVEAYGGKLDIIIAGGDSAISEGCATALSKWGSVSRVYGSDRYATNDEILKAGEGSWGTTAIVATGDNFADALAISSYASANKLPVILVKKGEAGSLSAQAKAVLAKCNSVVIAGGDAVVSGSVQAELESAVGAANVTRLAGSDRYATSQAIATWALQQDGFSASTVGIATGANFPDALASGFLLGKTGSVLLTVNGAEGADNSGAVKVVAGSKASVSSVEFFGGTAAVPQALRDAFVQAILG